LAGFLVHRIKRSTQSTISRKQLDFAISLNPHDSVTQATEARMKSTFFLIKQLILCLLQKYIQKHDLNVANINTSNIIYTKYNQMLGYADDLDVIGITTRDVANSFLATIKWTKVLLSSRKEASHRRLGENVTIQGQI
uniref:Reverse transcriptase domain-containing protein n=1 Tax=Megaselia scalaris TaxID=36166 RepID=T1H412_MEGSC